MFSPCMEQIETRQKIVVTLRGIDKELFEEIRVYALRHNSNVGPVLNEAMRQFLGQ